MSHRRTLDSYTKETILEWIERRGFSWFEEELDAIERGQAAIETFKTPIQVAKCASCADQGVVNTDGGLLKPRRPIAWCPRQCEASCKVGKAAPTFVSDWNARLAGIGPAAAPPSGMASDFLRQIVTGAQK